MRNILSITSLFCLLTFTSQFLPVRLINKRTNYNKTVILSIIERSDKSLNKLIDHYEHSIETLNLDGTFGFKVARDFLLLSSELLTDRIMKNEVNNLDDDYRDFLQKEILTNQLIQIERIHNIMGKVTEMKDDTHYFHQFSYVLKDNQNFEKNILPFRTYDTDEKLANDLNEGFEYDEQFGDLCFQDIRGKCEELEKCLDYMNKGLSQENYILTHSFLYFLFMQRSNCSKEEFTEEYLKEKMEKAGHGFLKDLNRLNENGTVADGYHDIFLEELTLSGINGVINAFTVERFNLIISWQNEFGCYNSYLSRRRRNTLFDMEHNCEAHESGLAASTLAAYKSFYLIKLLKLK
ncbi:hypothetical protein SNEBB_001650 [Seison nebaliae]|nr:hypothetical protein SNEBB_001650 [Seison nebaliae]